MGELHLPRLRGAVGFIADSSWREHRIEVFHDLPGQLVGQNSLNIGCGKQFGGCALPCSDTIDVVSHFPKVTRHSLSDNLFCAFFLVQHPNAVLFVQTQCFVVHVAPGHKNAGGLAHTLALHDPAGIGRTHQTVGACNLLERIVCGLFAQIWINSGDMPDVANAQFEFGELENYANQEAIYRLPDDWKERWPNVAKTQENVPAAAMAEEQLGGTYFLYRPVFSLNRPSERLSYHALIYLRKDWMEACGLELKDTYTPDELEEIAKTFLEKDPGNVGDNLVGMSIRPYDMVKLYPTTTFSEACNIGDGYYKDENGQFQWAPADTRTLDALKKYQDLYQEGILDSEFYSYTRYQGAQKFYVQGTSGLTLEDGHAIMITYIRNGLAEQGLDPDKVLHLAQLVGDDGMYHYREDSNYWGQVMFSPTISQEKFERAMDILDYTCTEEGQNFMNMGFEGIDWKLDENGNYVSLLDPSIQGSATSVLGGKYPSKESSFGGLILPDDFSLVSPNYSHEIQDTVRGFYKLREELSDTTTLLPREYEYEFLSSREKSQATMDLGDEYAKLILKDGELEDNWNTWVEEKMAVVQPVLDQLNK